MNDFIRSLIETIKVIGFYIIGVIVTVYILEPIYNLANVKFQRSVCSNHYSMFKQKDEVVYLSLQSFSIVN